jgi:chaperonin cofactor prefoldin
MTTRAATFLLILLGLATQGICAQPAQAPKLSSRDEYRVCLDEGDKLAPRLPVLQARLKDHNQALKRLQDEMVAHAATQPAVDVFDQTAVDEFNTKMESLNQRMKALNDQADEFNSEQIAYNTQVAAANKRCAGMVVTLNDRDAVRRERLTQGKK